MPTYVIKKTQREHVEKRVFVGRCYKQFNSTNVSSNIKKFLPDLWGDNPNLLWDQLETAFIRVADEVCPLKTFEIKKDRPSYFTDEISATISERDLLYKKARRNQSKTLWKKAILKRKEVKLLIKRAKRDYVRENIEGCKTNVKKYWRNMTKLLNRNKKRILLLF